VELTYSLSEDGTLDLRYAATTDAPTPVNLTNHSYFNLAGHDGGTVLDHVLKLTSPCWTATDDQQIPTGEMRATRNSPWDFNTPLAIGARMDHVDPLTPRGGYDLSYDLNNPEGRLVHAATVWHPDSGRRLTCHTTEPAVQLYTMNITRTYDGKQGAVYGRHAGVCLETQGYPDAVNHPGFPSVILRPGSTYRHQCVYRFDVAGGFEEAFAH